jgi:hypothetical protein
MLNRSPSVAGARHDSRTYLNSMCQQTIYYVIGKAALGPEKQDGSNHASVISDVGD